MLQFRVSIVLKELIQTSPKRSFSDIIRHKKTLPNAYIYNAAYPDGRISKLKTVCNGRPFILPLAGRRFLCTKTEGAIDPTEPVKKDESVQEATADKYEIYLFVICSWRMRYSMLLIGSIVCVCLAHAPKYPWMSDNVALCVHFYSKWVENMCSSSITLLHVRIKCYQFDRFMPSIWCLFLVKNIPQYIVVFLNKSFQMSESVSFTSMPWLVFSVHSSVLFLKRVTPVLSSKTNYTSRANSIRVLAVKE